MAILVWCNSKARFGAEPPVVGLVLLKSRVFIVLQRLARAGDAATWLADKLLFL